MDGPHKGAGVLCGVEQPKKFLAHAGAEVLCLRHGLTLRLDGKPDQERDRAAHENQVDQNLIEDAHV